MNEKTVITGRKGKATTLLKIAFLMVLISILLYFFNIGEVRLREYELYPGKMVSSEREVYSVLIFEANEQVFGIIIPALFYLGILISIFGFIFMLAYRKVSITVTDKRVYGTAAWGKRVDLPLDKISAVGTSFGHGIAVATSSGSIKFKAITNNTEVHYAISKLLMERQSTAPVVETQKQSAPIIHSDADELRKYKDLLDSGVITQEEFDTKKKKILGL